MLILPYLTVSGPEFMQICDSSCFLGEVVDCWDSAKGKEHPLSMTLWCFYSRKVLEQVPQIGKKETVFGCHK